MIYIIADDLTGATDTGVQFSKQGYNTHVVIISEAGCRSLLNSGNSTEDIDGNLKQVEVIAQIERIISASQALTKELDFDIIKKIIEAGLADSKVWGKARVLGYLTTTGELYQPKKAVIPGKPVYIAPTEVLEKFYSFPEEEAIEYLIMKDIPRRVWGKEHNRQMFRIVKKDQIPSDRSFRNAWRLPDD